LQQLFLYFSDNAQEVRSLTKWILISLKKNDQNSELEALIDKYCGVQ
jgi:hypothetical protein